MFLLGKYLAAMDGIRLYSDIFFRIVQSAIGRKCAGTLGRGNWQTAAYRWLFWVIAVIPGALFWTQIGRLVFFVYCSSSVMGGGAGVLFDLRRRAGVWCARRTGANT
ncbi:hypothetical protein [Massilia sp. TWP1-3-3]|uniref:hypothetical protein n=1 Tax=Massilia sp. TWP1-3-3 TaxID=2804573 RepID=UPI003CF9FF1D